MDFHLNVFSQLAVFCFSLFPLFYSVLVSYMVWIKLAIDLGFSQHDKDSASCRIATETTTCLQHVYLYYSLTGEQSFLMCISVCCEVVSGAGV